ncbi:carrier superfamily protein [Acanthamoeba castellanii str. Neff]|uniref:Carrier superfamily protein n=1 Tax=Acanthamoeba castellanii (strain ATCC 30010 / Neff) TaxID=1257118 RepID=L8GV61_ACACF|nr:carrier superfamily protein [Acanthamoeba castellanii str. Neff]ELR16895.1 carrier superfamily protein [Acanthamoeba castellanii str. Neff]
MKVEDEETTPAHLRYDLGVPFEELDLKKFAFFSSIAFFGESLIYYPLDVIRARLQVARAPFSISAFIRQVQQLGVRGMYRGFVASAAALPSFGVYFLSYNYAKDKLQALNDRHTTNTEHRTAMWVAASAACVADVASAGLLCPVEVVVQRLQIAGLNQTSYASGLDTTLRIWKEEGFRGYYRGFGAMLLTYIPGSVVWQQQQHQGGGGRDELVVGQHQLAQILGGLVAGAMTVVVTNPLDVVKTRLQTQAPSSSASGGKQPKLYAHSWEALRHMAKHEGLAAFGKGLTPRLLLASVVSPVASVVYETVLQLSRKPSHDVRAM